MKELRLLILFVFPFYGLGQLQTDTVLDIDGNVYHTIKIGTQVWMVENLKVTHFRNGDPIPELAAADQWTQASGPGYCIYDLFGFYLSPGQKDTLRKRMGKLYNGYTIRDNRTIAPEGWRIPSREDFKILENYLGGADVAGAKLKDTMNWQTKIRFNTHVLHTTNETGFTALPDGYRDETGKFRSISEEARWWTKKDPGKSDYMWFMIRLLNSQDKLFLWQGENLYGCSVRCVKE